MKNLSRTDAQAQARRLQACPALAPQSDEGRREIVDCLMRHCHNVEHASRTMTHVLDNCQDPRNLTAEIKAAAMDTMHAQQTIPDGCDRCRRENAVTGAIEYAPHVYLDGEYSRVGRCSCERGQWLRRRDQEREAQEGTAVRPRAMERADFGRLAAGDTE